MLEKIQKGLIELVLEAIREDRKGATAVPTTVVNGVINSFVAVENPKQRLPGDPSNHLTVSVYSNTDRLTYYRTRSIQFMTSYHLYRIFSFTKKHLKCRFFKIRVFTTNKKPIS